MIKTWFSFLAVKSLRSATAMDLKRQQSKISNQQSEIRWIVYFLLLIFDFCPLSR